MSHESRRSDVSPHAAWIELAPSASPQGGRLKREVFFFRSGPDHIYGTLFSGPETGGDGPGVVICPSWGFETYRLRDACYSIARRVAELGGAGMVFDWVGHGDSSGEPEDATLQRMLDVAGDALAHSAGLHPSLSWGYGGFRLGACVAAAAAERAGAKSLLLIQPSLDPEAHFEDIAHTVRRASMGRGAGEPWAFGSPLPDLRTWTSDIDAAAALSSFGGPAVGVRFARPAAVALPDGVEEIRVDGVWQTGLSGAARRDLVPLVDAAAGWLATSGRGRS
jgi:hypothetical protein